MRRMVNKDPIGSCFPPPSLDHTALLPVGGGGEARQGLGEQVPVPLGTSAVSRWAF